MCAHVRIFCTRKDDQVQETKLKLFVIWMTLHEYIIWRDGVLEFCELDYSWRLAFFVFLCVQNSLWTCLLHHWHCINTKLFAFRKYLSYDLLSLHRNSKRNTVVVTLLCCWDDLGIVRHRNMYEFRSSRFLAYTSSLTVLSIYVYIMTNHKTMHVWCKYG